MSDYSWHLESSVTLTQLEIFAMVAELGGFTVTAQRLGISQSAVSHALRQLEAEWGVTLLARDQGGVALTDIGQNLLFRVRELLGASESIRQELSAVRGLHRGILRIGSFGTTSSLGLLPRILARFHAEHPGIEVIVDEGEDAEVAQWITERRVDVGFVVLPDERFDTLTLVEDQFIALVPKDHPLAARPAVKLADLCDQPFILTMAGNMRLVQGLFESEGLRPQVRQRYSQIITIVKMVESGAGVSIVADLAVPDEIMTLFPGVLKKPLTPRVKRRVGLAMPNREKGSPALRSFLETAEGCAKDIRS